jgi:hypothetical protein
MSASFTARRDIKGAIATGNGATATFTETVTAEPSIDIGATRQWVTTSLDRIREQGLIEISPHKIIIRDEEALRRFAGQC